MKTTQIYLTSRAKPTSVSAQLKGEAGGARLGHSCWASLALPARARGGPRLPQDHRVGRGGRTPCPSGPATKSRRNKNRQNPKVLLFQMPLCAPSTGFPSSQLLSVPPGLVPLSLGPTLRDAHSLPAPKTQSPNSWRHFLQAPHESSTFKPFRRQLGNPFPRARLDYTTSISRYSEPCSCTSREVAFPWGNLLLIIFLEKYTNVSFL